ncbi:MAG TPA: OmpA family protein [Sandaracinaceae bacterium LLY-WYZ-13_1]|nr:OmpA family protein [Sandaracinaceae bacterium LLY-WYZ-13_1]
MTSLRRLAAIALALTALTAPVPADAQARLTEGGMDLRLVRPPLDSKGLLTLNGTDVLGENALSFGLILDAGFGVLPFEGFENDGTIPAADAERRGRLVDAMFTGTLHANWGIANLLVVGAQLPVSVISGPDVSIPGQYGSAEGEGGLAYQGLGGIVVHGKIRLLRPERDPIGLAASVQVELPTASPSEFAGDPILALTPSLIAEWRPAREVRLGLEVGYRLGFGGGATLRVGGRTEPAEPSGAAEQPRLIEGEGRDLRYEDTLRFGAGVGWRFTEVLELVAEVQGSQVIDDWGNPAALSLSALGGLKVFVERNSYLMLGGGAGLPTGGFQAPDAQALVGFVFEPSMGDRDGDGLRDDVDRCPDEPEDFDGFADEDGCPEPDDDRDGILDVDDECPLVPEDRDSDADEDGCPEGDEGDRDGDGILDAADECPDDPEDLDGWRDADGCPDRDNDADGLLDTDDLCPDDPEDVDDWEDGDGCPDPDNDDDRILDVDDACPDEPEEYNGNEDEDGCPDPGVIDLEDGEYVFFEDIHFAYDSAAILPESAHVLDAIAASLRGNPHIRLVEVQGHADDRGTDEYNIRLTRDRAAAVVTALAERGIAPSRMRSAGYGERCPEIPGRTARARDANRRVEIKVLRTEDGPTGVEVACPAGRELIPR